MIHDLVVFNSTHGKGGFSEPLSRPPWVDWSTCVRQMRIGFEDWLDADLAGGGLSGFAAYQYLLEVICGLHSPMLGETEVFGQFREKALSYKENHRISRVFGHLITDAKIVRQNHLTNLGANSYGSLTRKHTRDVNEVAILGSGKLALEIMPWLKGKAVVDVFARSPERKRQAFSGFKNSRLLGMDEKSDSRVLVVAAPIATGELETWIRTHCPSATVIIDLRENSSREPLQSKAFSCIVLKDFFLELNSNQDQIRQRIESAKTEIMKISEERLKTQDIRPFGWDDICA